MVLVNRLIDHGEPQQRPRIHQTLRRRSGWLSHDLGLNVGITDAMDDNSRHSAIFSGIKGKSPGLQPNLTALDAGQSSPAQRPGMDTFRRENARSKSDARALQIASES